MTEKISDEFTDQLVKRLKQKFTNTALDDVERTLDIPVSRKMRKWMENNWDDIRKGLEPKEADTKDFLYKCADQYFRDMCNFKDLKFKENEPMDKEEFEKEVNHPDRYCNKVECINFIREILGDKGAMYFCLGNTVKYFWRRGKKTNADDTPERDIQKGLWYFDKAKEIANGKLADGINAEIEFRSR